MAAPLWPIRAAAVLWFALPGGTSMSGEAWCFMLWQAAYHPRPSMSTSQAPEPYRAKGTSEMSSARSQDGEITRIIQGSPECNRKRPYKRGAEGDLTAEEDVRNGMREARGWSDGLSTRQRM